MEKDIENRSDTDEKKQVSIGKETNRRLDPSRCCFGLLSLRSGIYVVSVTTFVCKCRMNKFPCILIFLGVCLSIDSFTVWFNRRTVRVRRK